MKRQTVPPPVARIVSQMVLAATLLTTGAGCSKGTYLVLSFEGATLPAVYGIRVSLTVHAPDGTTRQSVGTLPAADNTSAIPLPTSAAFKLDDQTGTLDILAEALDLEKKTIAKQTVAGSAIHHGQTWTVTLSWDATASGKLTAAPVTAPPSLEPSATEEATLEARGLDPAWH
jgi:hypothetical protein